jgi:RNA-directed DNA polymerase
MRDNIFVLHKELKNKTYRHGGYYAFKINDPKPRDIHKASVRDRLLHHAIYKILYPHFDQKFVFDSYSCRVDKGTHRAINQFRKHARKVSKNHTRTAWVLKCDIRKFFASINHEVLKNTLRRHIEDVGTLWLLGQVIDSFHTKERVGGGIPLGNLTSQLFVNVYMNDFDHFVKRVLKAEYYIRYADDFVIVDADKGLLQNYIPRISKFLENRLRLSLHPKKISVQTFASGVDFLGWVHFQHHRVLRTSTKRRMFKKLCKSKKDESVTSYQGLISHGNTFKLWNECEKNLLK